MYKKPGSQAFKLKSKRMHLYHKTWNCSRDNYGLQRILCNKIDYFIKEKIVSDQTH